MTMTMTTTTRRAPRGYYAGLCRALTHRVMVAGVPFEALMILLFAGLQCVNLGVPALIVSLPLLWWVMRALYAHDEWGVGAWIEHARVTLQGATRLEV